MNKTTKLQNQEFTQIYSYIYNMLEDDEATYFTISEQLNSMKNGVKCEDGDISISIIKNAIVDFNYLIARNFDDDGYFDYEGMMPEPFEFTEELVEFLFENVHIVIQRANSSIEGMIAVIFADLIFTGYDENLKYIIRTIKYLRGK